MVDEDRDRPLGRQQMGRVFDRLPQAAFARLMPPLTVGRTAPSVQMLIGAAGDDIELRRRQGAMFQAGCGWKRY